MTITVLLTVAGTVVIFVEVNGWSSVRHKIISKSGSEKGKTFWW